MLTRPRPAPTRPPARLRSRALQPRHDERAGARGTSQAPTATSARQPTPLSAPSTRRARAGGHAALARARARLGGRHVRGPLRPLGPGARRPPATALGAGAPRARAGPPTLPGHARVRGRAAACRPPARPRAGAAPVLRRPVRRPGVGLGRGKRSGPAAWHSRVCLPRLAA